MSAEGGACGLWQKSITPLETDDKHDTEKKQAQYETIIKALSKFFNKYDVDCMGRMSTICSYLKLAFKYMSFVGFYVHRGDKSLSIGPYQGELIACGLIDFGKGVCGVAAEEQTIQRVDDVNKIENYIACDDVTQAEMVVPVLYPASTRVHSVLDIDSSSPEAFDETDEQYLQKIVNQFLFDGWGMQTSGVFILPSMASKKK
eukprot:gb/GECG01014255.1/.p1 GENE.gb/GECG01014255.1/~~gb/GECG01014255.1/.p1  ORF type:complete len:202 (+),score=30.85 gb/GECG01014255.1/:1-606(+)